MGLTDQESAAHALQSANTRWSGRLQPASDASGMPIQDHGNCQYPSRATHSLESRLRDKPMPRSYLYRSAALSAAASGRWKLCSMRRGVLYLPIRRVAILEVM